MTSKPSDQTDKATSYALPWAGAWVRLAVKAFIVADVGSTQTAAIESALTKLKTSGGSHRFYRGEFTSDSAAKNILGMFALLVGDMPWLPPSNLNAGELAKLLIAVTRYWEGVVGLASKRANQHRILTRGMLRQLLYESAVIVGYLMERTSPVDVAFSGHWESPEKLAAWMDSLWTKSGLTREELVPLIGLTESVWDRLVYDGEVPEAFVFDRFARAVCANSSDELPLVNALKRNFAAREFARLLQKEADVGAPAAEFWADAWRQFSWVAGVSAGATRQLGASAGVGRVQSAVSRLIGHGQPASIWRLHALAASADGPWRLWDDYEGFAAGLARECEVTDAAHLDDAVTFALLSTVSPLENQLRDELARAETFQEAERCLIGLLKICPDDPGCWSMLGSVYRREKLLERAEQALRKAASLPLSNHGQQIALATFLGETGKIAEARRILNAARDEQNGDWVFAMGCVAFDSDDRDQAIHWLTQTISMKRHLHHAHHMLMLVCERNGEPAKAEQHRREAERFRIQ